MEGQVWLQYSNEVITGALESVGMILTGKDIQNHKMALQLKHSQNSRLLKSKWR